MSHSITLASNAHLALIKSHRFRSLPEHQKELLSHELKRRKLNSLEIAALASETEAFALFESHVQVCNRCQQKKLNRNQAQKLGIIDFFRDEFHCIYCNFHFQSTKKWKKSFNHIFSFFLKPFFTPKS